MTRIPRKELRNKVDEGLHRAEAGEQSTVAGCPAAELGPTRMRRWVSPEQLAELWRTPPDPTLMQDLEQMGGTVGDPWDDA